MKTLLLVFLCMLYCTQSYAQDKEKKFYELEISDLSTLDRNITDLLAIKANNRLTLFGFMNTNIEKVFNIPYLDEQNRTQTTTEPLQWVAPQSFHLYGSVHIEKKLELFFNLAHTTNNLLEIRNAWGNYKVNESFQVRVGKQYRNFGLFNQKLDQLPAFNGIEPPEVFDQDHPFLSRTTDFMLHGKVNTDIGNLFYSVSTEQSQGIDSSYIVPLGWDLRLKRTYLLLGTSGYLSSINSTKSRPLTKIGDSSVSNGVLPWMRGSRFSVLGIFFESKIKRWLIQAEYWYSYHQAMRNSSDVLTLVKEANINQQQRNRFLGANQSKDNIDLTTNDIIQKTNYNTQTFYLRLSYNFPTNIGNFSIYLFGDWMKNPEIIANKNFGGDGEAGLSDDGAFFKSSLGFVYRPFRQLAIKLDGSAHTQNFNSEKHTYNEIRLDVSFAFK